MMAYSTESEYEDIITLFVLFLSALKLIFEIIMSSTLNKWDV